MCGNFGREEEQGSWRKKKKKEVNFSDLRNSIAKLKIPVVPEPTLDSKL